MIDLPDLVSRAGTWLLVPVLVLGAIVNFASSSPFERYGWSLYALALAVLTLIVALG